MPWFSIPNRLKRTDSWSGATFNAAAKAARVAVSTFCAAVVFYHRLKTTAFGIWKWLELHCVWVFPKQYRIYFTEPISSSWRRRSPQSLGLNFKRTLTINMNYPNLWVSLLSTNVTHDITTIIQCYKLPNISTDHRLPCFHSLQCKWHSAQNHLRRRRHQARTSLTKWTNQVFKSQCFFNPKCVVQLQLERWQVPSIFKKARLQRPLPTRRCTKWCREKQSRRPVVSSFGAIPSVSFGLAEMHCGS